MAQRFRPLFSNPHLLTVAGNFWRRQLDLLQFPARDIRYQIDERNAILVMEHQPQSEARAQIVLLHGLEGSASAGYISSLSKEALLRGFGIHRVNLRTCGGTEGLCETMYHSGLTGDTKYVLQQLRNRNVGPVFLVGFSLGGNVALKLAGELGTTDLVDGVCAVSTPIDLALSVRALDRPENRLYARRFLKRLRERIVRKSKLHPDLYSCERLEDIRTIWDFDDQFTAPLFGFGTAASYYKTQSAVQFLDGINVPTFVIAAKDDPIVPFEMYSHPAFRTNPALTLLGVEHGGHLGFISRRNPRFWLDKVIVEWMEGMVLARQHAAP